MISRRAMFVAAFGLIAAVPGMSPVWAQPSESSSSPSEDRGNARALTSAESYIPVQTLSAGVIGRFSSGGTLVVDVGLDVPDAGLRRRANALSPRVRDALRTALSTYANTYYRDNSAPDPTQMTRLMQTAVDRTLGQGGARVLLANLIYQQRR